MERVEAALHGWPQAPYATKAEVDANYKRMLEYGCRPEHARGRAPRRRQPQPLRRRLRLRPARAPTASSAGSSSRCSRAWPTTRRARCSARAGGLLLYAPVVRAEDFHSAIAYLVRRLDENTAPENFLRHVFDLEPGSADVDRRARSLPGGVRARRPASPTRPRRTQDRTAEEAAGRRSCRRRRRLRERARHRLDARREPRVDRRRSSRRWRERRAGRDPARRSAASSHRGARRGGRGAIPRDPSASPTASRWRAARDVDRALDVARAAQPAWGAQPAGGARGAAARRARPSSAGAAATSSAR